MADATITAANVTMSSGTSKKYTGGGTGTRGQVVYLDTTTNTVKLADANSAATATVLGILVTDMYSTGECYVALDGDTLNVGFTTAAGKIYVLTSDDPATANGNPGGICLSSELGVGDFVRPLFVGNGTAIVQLKLNNTGTALAV